MSEEISKLAIEGGYAVRVPPLPKARLGASLIGWEERLEVMKVLESGRLFRFGDNSPSMASELENQFAIRVGLDFTLAMSSGTAALSSALAVSGVGLGTRVILPVYTWVGVVNAVLMLGGVPLFANIDETLTLDPNDLANCHLDKTVAVVAVHMDGASANVSALQGYCQNHQVQLIEDCAQALGASYQGRSVGSVGHMAAFSFQFNKMVTTGEGGMLATNDARQISRAAEYHDQGVDRRGGGKRPLAGGVGTNFRMNEITAAVGMGQLSRLPLMVDRLRLFKNRILESVSDFGDLRIRPLPDPTGDSAISVIFLLPTAMLADRFSEAMTAEGIHTSTLWKNRRHIYHQFYPSIVERAILNAKIGGLGTNGLAYDPERYSNSEKILKSAIRIDLSPAYSLQDIDDIGAALRKVARCLL